MGSRPSRRCAAIPTENKPEKAFSISSSSSCPSSHECPVPGASPSVAPFSAGWRQPTISGRRPFSRRSGSESTSQFRTDGGGLPIFLSREKTDGAERKHGAITHPEASTAAKNKQTTQTPHKEQKKAIMSGAERGLWGTQRWERLCGSLLGGSRTHGSV